MDGQILNTVLQSLLDQISISYVQLLPVALYFLYIFATVNLVKLGLAYALDQNGNILTAIFTEFFKIGCILWTINYLPYLHEALRDGAIKLGIRAAGGTTTIDLILNPSNIAAYGVKVIMPIKLWISNMSWGFRDVGQNIVNILLGFCAMLLILGAFFYLAYQMFMTLVDFYFTSVLAPVFLAFHLFAPTAWMATGAIRGPIQHAVKLFTMAFIIGLAEPWIASVVLNNKISSFAEVSALVLASIVLVSLSLKAGTWAAGMFSGSPTASAGDLMTTGAAAVGVGMAGSMASHRILQSSQRVAGSLMSGAIATGAAGMTGAQLKGATYTGNSMLGKAASMATGAIQGTAAMLTPKALQEKISQSFTDSVSHGTRQGFIATGGNYQDLATNNQNISSDAAVNSAGNAAVYQRIAKAFQEHQDFNKH